jgi:hypothetical protein
MEYASKGDFSQVKNVLTCRLFKKEKKDNAFIKKINFGTYLNR